MNKSEVKIAAIIQAAGEGKRIGCPKALAQVGGVSFLKMAVTAVRETSCDPVIVIGGAQREKVKALTLALGVEFVYNANWQLGQFASLKAGLAIIPPETDAVMVVLVDHPLVTSATYNLLCEVSKRQPESIIMPIINGRRGHPIIIPRSLFAEIKNAPAKTNLREILSGYRELALEMPVEDHGILRDIDTSEELKELQRERSR